MRDAAKRIYHMYHLKELCHTNFLPLYHYKILLEQHGYSAIILALYMSYSLDTTRRGCLKEREVQVT